MEKFTRRSGIARIKWTKSVKKFTEKVYSIDIYEGKNIDKIQDMFLRLPISRKFV